jgi:hypothetical protein
LGKKGNDLWRTNIRLWLLIQIVKRHIKTNRDTAVASNDRHGDVFGE